MSRSSAISELTRRADGNDPATLAPRNDCRPAAARQLTDPGLTAPLYLSLSMSTQYT